MKIKIILIALIIAPRFGIAQSKKDAKISKKDIQIYVCQFLAGSADGVNQAIVHHYLGMGTPFWDFQTSWKNKYKNYDNSDLRPAFFGAKSVFVGFTDGYHLTRTIDRSFTSASLLIALGEKNSFKQIVKKTLISTAINRAGFLLFFNVLFPRRGAGLNR